MDVRFIYKLRYKRSDLFIFKYTTL